MKKILTYAILSLIIPLNIIGMDQPRKPRAKRRLFFGPTSSAKRVKISFSPNQMLINAIRENNLQLTQQALSQGADINTRNFEGNVLHHMFHRNPHNYRLIKFLLQHNANPNTLDFLGYKTPLHVAIRTSSYKTIQLLLEYKADVNKQNNCNETPTDWAIESCTHNTKDALYAFLLRGGQHRKLSIYNTHDEHNLGIFDFQLLIRQLHIARNWKTKNPQFFVDALKVFIHHKDYASLKILLIKYADKIRKYRDKNNNSALHQAVLTHNFKYAALLLTYFPELTLVKNNNAKTAYNLTKTNTLMQQLFKWKQENNNKFLEIGLAVISAVGYNAQQFIVERIPTLLMEKQ